MRKLYLLLLLCTVTILANAQLVNLYTFGQSNGTYTGITGGNVLGGNTSDDEVFNDNTAGAFGPITGIGFPIGFNFSYNGQTFDRFAVGYNGYIVLGTGSFAIGGTTATIINSTSTGLVSNVISAMNVDIDATDTSELSYSTIGTAPNRTLVVQWKNAMRYNQTGSVINMQIRLNENGNTVQIVYGNVVGPATAGTVQVGIKGQNNTDFRARTSTTSWAATTNAATASETIAFSTTIVPASGLTFTFTPPTGCTSAPPAGTVVGNSAVCVGVPFSLTVNGVTPTSGYAYQWQSSANGTDWADINGQIGLALNTTTTGVTYYRRVTTCTNTSQSTPSNSFMVTANAPTFATLPYNESFENTWQALCGDSSRATPNNSWRGVPTSGNTSWRRHDDGSNALWSSTFGLYSPVSTDGSFSARFHSYDASSGTFGNFDLYINGATASATKRITYDMINTSGTDTLFVQLSTDNGATFVGIDTVTSLTGSSWRSRSRIFTTTSAQTIIRFRARGDFGATDIGLDNISIIDFPSCNGAPVTPVIAAAATTLCDAGTRTFNITAGNSQNGVAFQWQISSDSTLWIPVTGQTGTSYTYVAPASFSGVFVRLISRCTATSDSSISNAIRITQPTSTPYATLPVAENFDNVWASVCDIRDVPNSFWKNTPITGSRSWRRYDDAVGGNWTSPTSGTYTPNGSNGTPFSARFHSSILTTGTGTFDLFVNCASGNASKEVKFFYANTNGTDSLRVLVSTNGGTSFSPIGSVLTTSNATNFWDEVSIPFTSTSATTIVRFVAYATGTNSSDIGIDEVSVSAVDCAQPQNVQVSAITPAGAGATRATVTWNNVAGNLGYEIAFAATNTPPSFGDVVLPNVVTYLDTTSVPANSNAFAFVRTFCAGGATSSWAVVPFVAPCAVGAIPYNEGFESITTANTLPECMSATQLGTLTQTYLGRQSTFYRKARTGSRFAAFRWSSTNRHLFSRPLLLQAGVQYGAEVWYVSDGTGLAGWDSLKLQIATNQTQADIIHSMARVAPVPNSSVDTNYVRVAGNFTPTTTGIYYLTVSAYGTSAPDFLSFDDLQLAPGNALPVTISSFTAERKGSTNLLQWITSTEANNLGFEIERSADGRNFTKVGYVASSATNGNSTRPIGYNFTDALPLTGNNYYRLKQIDKDGKTSYSNIALVKGNFGKELTLTAVYPNPATTTLNVLMNAPAFSKTQIVVTDLAGKVLNTYNYQLNAGDNTLSVNVAALPSGTYLIKAICDNGCESAVKKFFKQ